MNHKRPYIPRLGGCLPAGLIVTLALVIVASCERFGCEPTSTYGADVTALRADTADGGHNVPVPLTPAVKAAAEAAIASTQPATQPAAVKVVGFRIHSFPDNAVLPGMELVKGPIKLVLPADQRIVVEAVITGGKPPSVVIGNNGTTNPELEPPYTYGLQFQPQGWLPKPGLYRFEAVAMDAGNNPLSGVATMELTVVAPSDPLPPPVPPTAGITGTERYNEASDKWEPSWTLPVGDDGWIAWPRKPDCVDFYVNQQNGNDSNPGTSSEQPVKTIYHAMQLAQRLSGRQWYMHLAAGQRHGSMPDPGLLPSGTKAFPNVVCSWGNGRAEVGRISLYGQSGIALVDLAVINRSNDKSDAGILVRSFQNVAIEGCEVTGWQNGILALGADGKPDHDLIIRRSVIHHNASVPGKEGHSQGIYTHEVDGVLDEQNTWHHNGWKIGGGGRTMFNHNHYFDATTINVVCRDGITSQGAATGSQRRAGGKAEWFLVLDSPNGMTFGLVNGGGPQRKGGVFGTVNHLVIDGSFPLANVAGGASLTVSNIKKATFSNVYILNGRSWAVSLERGNGVAQNDAAGIRNLTVDNLVVWKTSKGGIAETAFTLLKPGDKVDRSSYAGNLRRTSLVADGGGSFAKVLPGVSNLSGKFKDPRDVDRYAIEVMHLPGREALAEAACRQSRAGWDDRLTARAIITWIEAGFEPLQ